LDLINKNIKTLRRLENIKSQSEFGDRIGVPSHNVNKYENNVIPKPDVLRSIAATFTLNLHLFLTKEITDSNYEEFKIEHNTEAKLEDLISDAQTTYDITRSDIDRIATFFGDKLHKLQESDLNELDKRRLFNDLRAIFHAYHQKLKDFYEMQDHLAKVLGDRKI